ncbi:MAG: hypothetical protein KGH75_03770 [Rhodospirillales bacterium]|nr:hypothetical protein [Rhodospirillales bacterium]
MPDAINGQKQLGDNALDVSYLNLSSARARCANGSRLLGVVGYGTERPDFLPPHTPFISTSLKPAVGGAGLELWQTSSPCRGITLGPVTGACSDDFAFGAITLADAQGKDLEEAVHAAYLAIFDFLESTGFTAPLRFWNYLSDITREEAGLERYRWFNIGRERAFEARLRETLPPAASGVGGTHGASAIYFLAAPAPAHPVENPRQVSAFAYPPVYGPQSPSFSRASVYNATATPLMFISGTASIIGHESRHANDLPGQIAETIENLRAVIGAAGITAPGGWAFKIYLRNPAYRDEVEPALVAAFGAATQRLYLHGEICRAELMLEIEAFYTAA